MIRYKKHQFTSENHPLKSLRYVHPAIEEIFDTEMLAKHMANHNIPYSAELIRGAFTDTIAHTKELILDGKNVRLDDLTTLFVGIVSKRGVVSVAELTLANNVKGLKLRARATNEPSNIQINLEGQLKEASKYNVDNGSGNDGSAPDENSEKEGGPLEQAFHPSDKHGI